MMRGKNISDSDSESESSEIGNSGCILMCVPHYRTHTPTWLLAVFIRTVLEGLGLGLGLEAKE